MDAILVFGWEIKSKFSKSDLDDVRLPGNRIYWVCVKPYSNAPSDDRRYFVSLINNQTECNSEDLSLLSFSRTTEAKQIIENMFGIKVGSPTVMSIVNFK